MTAPTPGDTYALIAARQRQQAITDLKRHLGVITRTLGPHHPRVDAALERLAALTREDT